MTKTGVAKTEHPPGDRLSTGVPGLDVILGGGFFRGGIYIVQGAPGSGKTILANQICFAEIAQGRRALYVTLLAESHARMIANLHGLSFFDDREIPGSLYYVSAFNALEQEGLRGVLDLLRREMRNHQASVMVIDGLVAAEQAAKSNLEIKKFVHGMQSQGELAGCTTFLLTSVTSEFVGPERTMVDGLVELSDPLFGSQRERRLEMSKFRGSRFLRGHHAFEITDAGLEVYPRTEAVLARPTTETPTSDQRVSAGTPGLDEILRGGYPLGSTSMVLGPSGVGKTTLGLHFMSGCSRAEPGVYLSFYETQSRVALKARHLGLPVDELMANGSISFIWTPTTECILDAITGRLVEIVRKTGARRIFIDGLDGFNQMATDTTRQVRVFTALSNEFRAIGATTLYTHESHNLLAGGLEAPPIGVSTILENLIVLRYAEIDSHLRRLISVMKIRDSDFDPSLREFEITNRGMVVKGPLVGWENLAGGVARKQNNPAK